MMKRFVLSLIFVTVAVVTSARADDGVREVQSRLKAGGFYFGEVTGKYDSATAAGVTRYQIRNGLQITGKLDDQTRYALGVSATPPKVPPPKFGEDVWRYLRKSDQAAITKAMEEDNPKTQTKKTVASVRATPPAKATPPPPAEPTRAVQYDTDRLKGYIAAFVLAGLDPQVGAETEFFADRVDYFGEHGVGREKIRRDLQRYNQQWPQRGFWLAGNLDVRPAGARINVSFPLRYDLRNGSKHATGKVWKTLVLEKTGGDDLEIVSVNERKL
jgi:peptidoglycan hydrolase-like protein with peptidoglycan-binding domain